MKVWVLAVVRADAVADVERWHRFQDAFPPGLVHRDCSEYPPGHRARILRCRAAASSPDEAAAVVVPMVCDVAAQELGQDVEVEWMACRAGPRFFLTRKRAWRKAAEAGGDGQVGVREPRRPTPPGFPPATAALDETAGPNESC
jgi:hypothetical protein